ncbi:hypothetical protein V6N13_043734 [Hibiscus sabdariffa]
MAFVSKIMAFVKVYSGGSGGDDDKFLGIPMLSLFLLIRCVFDVLDEEEWLSPAIFLAFHGYVFHILILYSIDESNFSCLWYDHCLCFDAL